MNFWRNVIGLTLAGGLLGVSGSIAGCVDEAEAKMAEPSGPVQASTTSEIAPRRQVAHWRFSSLVEHGTAGRIGQNEVWDLAVFEVEGRSVARLRKLAVDGEAVQPGQDMSATFAFDPRSLGDDERATLAGSRWAEAQVVETQVELRGAFSQEPITLRLWLTDGEVAGVWSAGAETRRGGPLLGSAKSATPPPLRDVDGLPCALRCEALGKSDVGTCNASCVASS